ncbi:MAG TPA: cyclophilin-like fold protein [Labilithrix sp.]|nr:cyclophilin-like fold protein [Labilithrix sp.]
MKLRLITKDAVLMATLDDNAATRDFVSLLPLSLTLRDYAGTEKVSDLPRRLSTSGTPPGVDPERGDLAYYAPWGNLAIFYRDFGYSSGLVKLGRIDSGIEKLANARGELAVRLELAEQAP